MYFKYFSNVEASYMVSKMQVIEMLCSDEKTYREKLKGEFDLHRDEYFLSEFMYVIPNIYNIEKTELLKRFYVYIELSYLYGRFINESYFIKSPAEYEGLAIWRQKLYPILSIFYGKYKYKDEDKSKIVQMKENFENLCKNAENINLLFVTLNIISNYLASFIFGREEIKRFSKLLVDRFFNEKFSQSNGILGYQEIDTIIQIKSDFLLEEYWIKKFEQYLTENRNACLNILCRMVEFYRNGKIGWNWHYRNAILGEYALPQDNILAHLIVKYPDEKDFFESLLSLHNHFRSLEDVSGLDDEAYIKLAKERNI